MGDHEMAGEARKYCVDTTMIDGSAVRIRAIRPDDQERMSISGV
jgi:hypothetical protein